MRRFWAIIDSDVPSDGERATLLGPAIGAAAMAVLLTWLARFAFDIHLPFLFCIVAVMVTAFRGGLPAGAATMLLSLTGSWLVASGDARLMTARNLAAVVVVCTALGIAGELLVRIRKRERRLATAAARRERTLQAMFDESPAVMLVVDARDQVIAANEAACRLFGRVRAELTGSDMAALFPAEADADGLRAVTRRDGSTVHLRTSETPLLVGGHDFRKVYVRDETSAVRAAEQLAMTQRELYQIARATSLGQLGSSIAHELNQPLAVIANYAGAARALLASEPVDLPAVRAAMDDALAQVFRASAVLKKLRDFVGRRSPTLVWTNAREVLDEALRLARLAVKEVQAQLDSELSGLSDEVLVDAVQLQQVILNLVLNAADAVRRSDDRRIRLRAWPDGTDTLAVAVEDSGPGFGKIAQRDVFAPFRSTKPDGVGIGLAICRTIVEAHGGRIWCDRDTALGGARFVFTLPRRQGEVTSDAA